MSGGCESALAVRERQEWRRVRPQESPTALSTHTGEEEDDDDAGVMVDGKVEFYQSSLLFAYYIGYLCMVIFFGTTSDEIGRAHV